MSKYASFTYEFADLEVRRGLQIMEGSAEIIFAGTTNYEICNVWVGGIALNEGDVIDAWLYNLIVEILNQPENQWRVLEGGADAYEALAEQEADYDGEGRHS